MTLALRAKGLPPWWLAIMIVAAAGPAWSQNADPAPYLHTHEHDKAKPRPKLVAKPVKKLRTMAIPVVKPHHGGPPRHALHEMAAKLPPPKPAVEAAKAAPKKPLPPAPPPNIGPSTGLPLPRYASLKSDDVNMRSGPGERYPVLWNYQRRDLPVKIEHEFDIWRQVEDMDGIKGWIQQGFLAGHRSFVITGTQDRTLRAQAAEAAEAVAVLKPGVVGRLKSCDAGQDWCQVQVQDYRGWLKRSDVWGVDPSETIGP